MTTLTDQPLVDEAKLQALVGKAVGDLGATLSTAMISLGARVDRIAAAVGPCIAQRNYEVDQGYEDRLLDDDGGNDRFFVDGHGGKPHFDLEAYVAQRLAAAGVRRIEVTGLDTYALEDRFYSYRRATHRGDADYGRQFSLIGLAP